MAVGGHNTGFDITITGHNRKMLKWETCIFRLNPQKMSQVSLFLADLHSCMSLRVEGSRVNCATVN